MTVPTPARRRPAAAARVLLAAALAVALLGCGSDDDDAASTDRRRRRRRPSPTGRRRPTRRHRAGGHRTATPPTPPTTTTAATRRHRPRRRRRTPRPPSSPPAWEQVVPGGDCQCADGSEFSFWVRQADPTKVVLYFQGGGACFSPESCAFTGGTYKPTTGLQDDPTGGAGVLDLADPRNPLAGYSFVFVPYCTGDVHIGDTTNVYSPELTVQHKGAVNAAAAVRLPGHHVPRRRAGRRHSARAPGASRAPLYAGEVSDLLPDADIVVLADSSGAYPDVAGMNALIGSVWGTVNAIPPWPENAGQTAETWSAPRPVRPGRAPRPGHHVRPSRLRLRRHPGGLRPVRRGRRRPARHADRRQRGADRGGRCHAGELRRARVGPHRAQHPRLLHRDGRRRRRSSTGSRRSSAASPSPTTTAWTAPADDRRADRRARRSGRAPDRVSRGSRAPRAARRRSTGAATRCRCARRRRGTATSTSSGRAPR